MVTTWVMIEKAILWGGTRTDWGKSIYTRKNDTEKENTPGNSGINRQVERVANKIEFVRGRITLSLYWESKRRWIGGRNSCNLAQHFKHEILPQQETQLIQGTSAGYSWLEGTREGAIVNIQYPFNWLNFNEKFVDLTVSVNEKEGYKEKQIEEQPTEVDTPLAYFKAQFRLSSMEQPLDPNAKNLMNMRMNMQLKLDWSLRARN